MAMIMRTASVLRGNRNVGVDVEVVSVRAFVRVQVMSETQVEQADSKRKQTHQNDIIGDYLFRLDQSLHAFEDDVHCSDQEKEDLQHADERTIGCHRD